MIHLLKLLAYVILGEFAALGNLTLPFTTDFSSTVYLAVTLLAILAIAVIAADSLFQVSQPRRWIKYALCNVGHAVATSYALLSIWLWNSMLGQQHLQAAAHRQVTLNALFALANIAMLFLELRQRRKLEGPYNAP